MPSENELGKRIGVSRTTIRKVLRELVQRGIVVEGGAGSRKSGRPVSADDDYYPDAETTSRTKQIEEQFMEWMLRGDTRPGMLISELDLARQFGVATNGIREFLIRFRRYGLIAKRPNSGWQFNGFNEAFALELFEIRMMFELRSARLFATLPDSSPLWEKLEILAKDHRRPAGANRHAVPRLLGARQPLSPADQRSLAEPLHRRFLRHHHLHFPLPLPVEQDATSSNATASRSSSTSPTSTRCAAEAPAASKPPAAATSPRRARR